MEPMPTAHNGLCIMRVGGNGSNLSAGGLYGETTHLCKYKAVRLSIQNKACDCFNFSNFNLQHVRRTGKIKR